jgi:hypothetical protein
MTDEELAALRARSAAMRSQDQEPTPAPASQPQSAPQPAPQSEPVSQPAPASQSRGGAQQSMRERMRAERNMADGGQQVTLQQTENYQPNQAGAPQPTPQPQSQPVPNAPQPNAGGTTTLINTTQSGSGGFKLSKPLVFGIVAVVFALLVIAFIMFGGDKDEESTEPNLDDLEWLDPVNTVTFLYTPDEITNLRAAGYTGDEIEQYQSQSIPADDLIAQAEAERDAWVQQAVAPLYDTASDEYKHYVSQTWLTLPQRTDMEEWTMIAASYTERKNLDYEKIDVYGNQLFIKVYLDDNAHEDWFFLNVTPDDWNKLQDSGNVIVNYTYYTHLIGDDYLSAVEDTNDIYITAASIEIIN